MLALAQMKIQPLFQGMALGLLLWICCIPHVIHAQVLTDTFEGYSVGVSPSGANGWTVQNTSANQNIQIVSGNSWFSPTGTQSLHYFDNDTASLYDVNLRNDFASTSGANVAVSYDVQYVAGISKQPLFQLLSGTTIALRLALNTSGQLTNWLPDGSTQILSTTTLQAGIWYRYNLTLDIISDTYSLQVLQQGAGSGDDAIEILNISGLSFRTNVDNINRLEFRSNFGTSQSGMDYLLDNVAIVPEPASLLLIGIGVLVLVIRRKRDLAIT